MTPDYSLYEYNLHIYDSALATRAEYTEAIDAARDEQPNFPVILNRSRFSMILETAAHNLLYALHIARERTKDADLNYPQGFFTQAAYAIVGLIAMAVGK